MSESILVLLAVMAAHIRASFQVSAYSGMILQADVSESADMLHAPRVAIYTCEFASRFVGADKSAQQIAVCE